MSTFNLFFNVRPKIQVGVDVMKQKAKKNRSTILKRRAKKKHFSALKRKEKKNRISNQSHGTCCVCGCELDSTAPFYIVDPPITDKESLEITDKLKSGSLPIARPNMLLDIAERMKKAEIDTTPFDNENRNLKIGDTVKLWFIISDLDREEVKPPNEFAQRKGKMEQEGMWVEITKIYREWPNAVYEGRLCNSPVFISRKRLDLYSPVYFEGRHIFIAEYSKIDLKSFQS
jgi:hypothetical protein